jgi:GMC oxidoreductase
VAGFLGDNQNFATGAPTDAYNYLSVVAALVAPLSRGTISISSADTKDQPLIDPRWLTDPADQAVAVAAYKRLREFFATQAMAPVLIGPEYFPGGTQTDEELLALIKKGFNTVWHASCTCKMGTTNDNMAVVDSKAKVFGVDKLRVVDASAFPVLPPGHPVSTVCEYIRPYAAFMKLLMIGYRLTSVVQMRWQRRLQIRSRRTEEEKETSTNEGISVVSKELVSCLIISLLIIASPLLSYFCILFFCSRCT